MAQCGLPLKLSPTVLPEVEGFKHLLKLYHLKGHTRSFIMSDQLRTNVSITLVHVTLCAHQSRARTNLRGQMDVHGGVGGPVAHGENVDSQIDVAGITLVLHVLE